MYRPTTPIVLRRRSAPAASRTIRSSRAETRRVRQEITLETSRKNYMGWTNTVGVRSADLQARDVPLEPIQVGRLEKQPALGRPEGARQRHPLTVDEPA